MFLKRRYHRLRTDRIVFALGFTALAFLGLGACLGLASAPSLGDDPELTAVLQQSERMHADAARRIVELRAELEQARRGEGSSSADGRALARIEELEQAAIQGAADGRVLSGFAPAADLRLVSVLGSWARELDREVRLGAGAVDRRVDLSRLPKGATWGAIKTALYEQGLMVREDAQRGMTVELRFRFR